MRHRDFNATVIARVKSRRRARADRRRRRGAAAAQRRRLPVVRQRLRAGRAQGRADARGRRAALPGPGRHPRPCPALHPRRRRAHLSLQRADAEKGWSGTTVNIAQEGLLARTQLPVAMDDAVAVTLWLPAVEQPLALQAKVVRHGGDMVALHFVDVGPFEQAAIAEFVIETRCPSVSRSAGNASPPARGRGQSRASASVRSPGTSRPSPVAYTGCGHRHRQSRPCPPCAAGVPDSASKRSARPRVEPERAAVSARSRRIAVILGHDRGEGHLRRLVGEERSPQAIGRRRPVGDDETRAGRRRGGRRGAARGACVQRVLKASRQSSRDSPSSVKRHS